jgi:hypothetical protein
VLDDCVKSFCVADMNIVVVDVACVASSQKLTHIACVCH